jgi:D-glycero-D-manno-heptose 1,7-bisphosphate phosphatase
MLHKPASRRAVFLDRDGTITRDRGFTHRISDLELLPGAAAGLAQMARSGFRLFVVTNQSGVARGYFSEADVQAFHDTLAERLRVQGVTIEGFYFCPFHPTEGRGVYRQESSLRKPADGMLRRCAIEHGLDLSQSVAIGDRKTDIAAGQAAGCRTILVRTGVAGGDNHSLAAPPDFVADDLLAAAHWMETAIPLLEPLRLNTAQSGSYPQARPLAARQPL